MFDLFNFINIVILFLGLIFTGIQLMQNRKFNRANMIKDLYFTLYDDNELRDFFYKIEWSDYRESDIIKLGGTNEELVADKLLGYYDRICKMYYCRVITKKDMELFSYEMLSVYNHPDVQNYFKFLEKDKKTQNYGKFFTYYKKFCEMKNKESKNVET